MSALNMSPVDLIVRCHEKPCRECGSIDSIIGNCDGQRFELVCAVCHAHPGRLSEKTLSFIVGIICHVGRPTKPIILRIAVRSATTDSTRSGARGCLDPGPAPEGVANGPS
jgi:hypothetical protein